MTDVSTTCAVVSFRDKVSCITSVDGVSQIVSSPVVRLWLALLDLVNKSFFTALVTVDYDSVAFVLS